ncbi:MAG: FkbM family methyltransferase [Candidatus Hydrogenedentota bacterium]|jgi:FkbM family methyltransferase|nr:MAG: FkbM family methyltransferase [Candidatus Hydrogenedentota bacterium]GIX44449.1 MAG: hypothetical protein KatS3mg130_0857 [Candidatus Sumerlaea sp.]
MSVASFLRKWRLIHEIADDAETARQLRALFWSRYRYPGSALIRRVIPSGEGLVHLRLRLRGAVRPVELILRSTDVGDIASLFENVVESDVRSLFQSAPRFVVDAGAHIGVFSLIVSAYFPEARILAIEPNRANIEILERNFSANQVHGDIQPVALWNENTPVGFSGGQSNAGRIQPDEREEQVQARTLSSILGDSISEVDFLKLDIEGAELAVLPDVLPQLPQTACIYVELHDAACHSQLFHEICRRAGWCGQQLYQYPPHEMWLLKRSAGATHC